MDPEILNSYMNDHVFRVSQMFADLYEVAAKNDKFNTKFIDSLKVAYSRSASLSSAQKKSLINMHQKWCKGKYQQ